MQTLKNIGSWIRKHFDFALLLAALVEIPRWTVTFLAIHEPLWVGIPLGALLAYATSEGWRAYFADPRRIKLLCFNIASLAAATFVITPVLFSMASAPIDEIDLAALLPFGWLLAWSGVLAITTFAPLIQLAAVKSTPSTNLPEYLPATPTEGTAEPRKKNKGNGGAVPTVQTQPAATEQASEGVDVPAVPAKSEPAEQAQDGDKLTPAQRRAQILSAGLQTPDEVIAMFGVGKRTADGDLAWVRKNLLQTNGTGAH